MILRLGIAMIGLVLSQVSTAAWLSETRLMYLNGYLRHLNDHDYEQLKELQENGVNTIILGWQTWTSIADQQAVVQLIRSHAVLSKFKWIFNIGGHFSPWNYFDTSSQKWVLRPPALNSQQYNDLIQQNLQGFFDNIIEPNQDLIAGYYFFDEPNQWDVYREYQEIAYQIMRSIDPDSVRRPILNAHTHPRWHPSGQIDTDAEYQDRMSRF
jgi:hypothetical protein